MKDRLLKIIVLPIIFAFLIAAAGCSDYSYSAGDFYAGETVTPGQLAEISASLANSGNTAAEETEEKQAYTVDGSDGIKIVPDTTGKPAAETTGKSLDTDALGNIIVYWTKSGGVWHYDHACSSLVNSVTIESGIVEEAMAAGKSRACQRCGSLASQ